MIPNIIKYLVCIKKYALDFKQFLKWKLFILMNSQINTSQLDEGATEALSVQLDF